MLGILNIDKPEGITSHDVVNRVRRKFGTKRVGHAGTLDPLATGVLVVAVGPATRFLQYLPLEPKEYEFTVKFGQETTTQDSEGEIVAEHSIPSDLLTKIQSFLPGFIGEIQQIPPMYSAVKKGGKPLYAFARAGQEVEREPRTIYVKEFDLLSLNGNVAEFRVLCSGGTYVRTLGHDLGQLIGCGAHVIELARTLVGKFDLDSAVPLEEVEPIHLISLREALPPLPLVQLSGGQALDVWNGQAAAVRPVPQGPFVGLLDVKGRVFGAARVNEKGFLQPECVIPREALP